MTRNVTDAADRARRDDRHRPERSRRPPSRPATPSGATRRFLDKHALRGARIGVWRDGHLRPDRQPGDRRAHERDRRDAQAQGATVVDPTTGSRSSRPTSPSSRRSCASSRTTSPSYLDDVHRRRLPEDAPGPDRLQRRPSRASKGPWNSELFVEPPRRPAAGPIPPARRPAQAATSIAQAAIDDTHGGERPRRDHRPDERPGLGDRSGERRPRRRLLDVRRIVEPVGDRRLPEHHRPGRLRRPAADRRVVHRRPLGRADAHRLRLRLRAGDPRPRPAAVPPHHRRPRLPRRAAPRRRGPGACGGGSRRARGRDRRCADFDGGGRTRRLAAGRGRTMENR